MKKERLRRSIGHRVGSAVVLAMPLALGLAAAPAGAETTRWGFLPTSDDKWVYQWELADWIGKSFRDGNTSDNTVNTSMTLFFTQCYAGDWLPSFNATAFESPPNGAYDRWVYANASAFAGNEPGLETIYGGYHRAAGLAFSPNATGGAVHSAGIAGSDPSESPIFSGDPGRLIGGDNTYVLVFAGQPEGPDWQDVGNLYIRSLLRADTTLTALSGTGVAPPTLPLPASLDLRPAGRDDLKAAITEIGGSLSDLNFDRFSLFVTDHGGLSTVELEPATVLPGAALNLDLPFLQGQVLGADQSEYGLLQFGFYMPPAEMVGLEHLSVQINGFELPLRDPVTVLAEAFDPAGGPDPVIQYMFGFQFDLDWLNRDRPSRIGDFSQFVNISLRPGAPAGSFLDLAWVALSPGPVVRPGLVVVPVPEPGALALMLIGVAGLGAAAARRSRSRR